MRHSTQRMARTHRSTTPPLLPLLLLMLVLCSSLCAAHTTAALLNKAGRSVAKHSRRAGSAVSKAGGTAIKAGTRLSRQVAGSAAAAGLQAGRVVVEASSSGARRVSQRTWEAAKAARLAAKAAARAAHETLEQQQQQQQQQQVAVAVQQAAQELTAAALPSPAAPAAAAATAALAKQQSCDLDRDGFCIVEDSTPQQVRAAASVPVPQQEHTQAAAPGATPPAAAQPQQQEQQQQATAKGWSAGWLVLTHAFAFCWGWLLRGMFRITSHQQQQQQQEPPAPALYKQQQQEGARPNDGQAAPSSSCSSRQRGGKCSSTSSSSSHVHAAAARRRASGLTHSAQRSHRQGVVAAAAAAAPAGEQQHFATNPVPAVAIGAPCVAASPAGPVQKHQAAAEDAASEAGDGSDTDSYVVCEDGQQQEEVEDSASSAGAPADVAPPMEAHSTGAGSSFSSAAAGTAAVQAPGSSGGRASRARQEHVRLLVRSNGVLVPVGRRQHSSVRRHQAVSQSRELLHVQRQQQALLAGGGQQGVQVVGQQTMIINHNNLVISEEVVQLLLPVATCLQEVGDSLKHLTDVGRRWVGWSTQQDAQQRLAAQQELLDRAGHWGQLLSLVAMGVVALRAGRVWEVHQVCSASMQQPAGWRRWAHHVTGTNTIASGLLYLNCCSQQLGLYAAGLFALYMVCRAVLSGAPAYRSGSSGRPSNAFQLDLLVVKGLICSWLGAHLVHCLGGAWLPWLAGWLAWCGVQLRLHMRLVGGVQSGVSVALVALVLPLAVAWGPFRPEAILAQGWLVEAVPLLRQVPSLGRLLPWAAV